jgi:small subunit ribosomal protein S17
MKIFKGKVISTKMQNTATVAVESVIVHPLYKKRFKRDKKYQVHDEIGVNVGDVVSFTASKPYSRTKKWKIIKNVGVKKGVELKK